MVASLRVGLCRSKLHASRGGSQTRVNAGCADHGRRRPAFLSGEADRKAVPQAGLTAQGRLCNHARQRDNMRLRLTGSTFGLAVGITAAVGLAFGGGVYLFSVHHYETLLGSARATALAQAELIREALEHQMIENDRTLIAQMVESFGRQPGVASVVLLDRAGRARYASGPRSAQLDLNPSSPTCQACHRFPPAERGTSRVIEVAGGKRWQAWQVGELGSRSSWVERGPAA